VGKSFGILKVTSGVETFDVSLPRRESKEGRGHKDFVSTPDPHMRYEEAAARRDFTINTIGFDCDASQFLDPFNGRKDLQDRILCATSHHFEEDPLRVLRAAQFAARFGLHVDLHTMDMCQSLRSELPLLPKERLWEEWKKLLLKAERPSIGIEVMRVAGVLEELFPELDDLIGVPQEYEWHPEGNQHPLGSLWVHNQMVVDAAAQIVRREGLFEEEALIVMLGALCHDLGQPETTQVIDGRIRSPAHDQAGVPVTRSLLSRMGCPPSIIEEVLPLVANHLAPSTFKKQGAGPSAIRRLALKVPLGRLVLVAEADHMGRATPDVLSGKPYESGPWLLEQAEKLNVLEEGPKPLLMGRHLLDLGFKPGPGMGAILKDAFEAQLDGAFSDVEGAWDWLRTNNIIGPDH
jgi:tRNA nucleotidyltransferase (CCA-adding enzyme)